MFEGSPRRLHPRADIAEGLDEHLEMQRQERMEYDATHAGQSERTLEMLRDRARVPVQNGFLSAERLSEIVRERADLFAEQKWTNVEGDPTQTLCAFDGVPFALGITGKDRLTRQDVHDWITLTFAKDGTAHYVFRREVIATVTIPPEFDMAWLQDMSLSVKVVKSRPAWMYPDLFDLPKEEVWPPNAKVAVIGDPYQACDRPGTTIVEFEYAEEIVPPMIEALIGQSPESFDAGSWLENLHFEEVRALNRMYGFFTPPEDANPYRGLVDQCTALYGDLFARVSQRPRNAVAVAESLRPRLRALKEKKERLVQGSWSLTEGFSLVGCESEEAWVETCGRRARSWNKDLPNDMTPEERAFYLTDFAHVQADVAKWHDFKEGVREQNGNPKQWTEFVSRWEALLNILPNEALTQAMPTFERDLSQARYWLETLPTSKSPRRIQTGRNDLNRFFASIFPHLETLRQESLEALSPSSDESASQGSATNNAYRIIAEVEQVDDREFGAFGYFQPGFAVSLRTKIILDELIARIEQLMVYSEGLVPHLTQEIRRITRMGISLDANTKHAYLQSFERGWTKQHLFRKRTQHAVPIHGFFPYRMPGIDPQDRILAHTSVTMHGWNHTRETEFQSEIELALTFLKVGGKYILGTINQHVFYGGVDEGFDADGLTRALETLEEKGLIDYSFKKGVRPDISIPFDDQVGEDDAPSVDSDVRVLHRGESAHSLVITRLA